MTIHIRIIDKTGKNMADITGDLNLQEINPLELMSKKIENGELEILSYDSTFDALTGVCETEIRLQDKTPHLNEAYYRYKAQEIGQRMEQKRSKSKKLDCTYCEHHDYDTLFGGDDEYEICHKNHELHPDECPDFKEL